MAQPRAQGHIAVSGAGPAGLLAAVYLARRGFRVDVYERRPRPAPPGAGSQSAVERQEKAFNVVVHARGMKALAEVCLEGVPPFLCWGCGVGVSVGGGS